MAKWFNHRTWIQYQKDIKVKRGHDLDMYLPYVIQIANTFPRHSQAIGCLDINDLIQAGNKGLVEAWERADKDRPQPELWSFLKKRIKFAIRQEIDVHANEIKIPQREIRDARKNLRPLDKILVNIFPQFFDEEIWIEPNFEGTWQAIQLEGLINDALCKYVPNVDHRDILLKYYGIGYDKYNQKRLAKEYGLSTSNIQNIVSRIKKKLKNQEFEKLIENFYENQ